MAGLGWSVSLAEYNSKDVDDEEEYDTEQANTTIGRPVSFLGLGLGYRLPKHIGELVFSGRANYVVNNSRTSPSTFSPSNDDESYIKVALPDVWYNIMLTFVHRF